MIKELNVNLFFFNIKFIKKIQKLNYKKKLVLIIYTNIDKIYLKYSLEFLLTIKINKINIYQKKNYIKKLYITYL
uniref:Uncharacterized protein n=1 Tax=Nephromyces sp. ex Molgula occidentalis TaxID=2544991 RepID=A0A5C1H7M1_9APIC|nr:hypothetical protein [Nephromyces sp. ex Molgula occidentalis]